MKHISSLTNEISTIHLGVTLSHVNLKISTAGSWAKLYINRQSYSALASVTAPLTALRYSGHAASNLNRENLPEPAHPTPPAASQELKKLRLPPRLHPQPPIFRRPPCCSCTRPSPSLSSLGGGCWTCCDGRSAVDPPKPPSAPNTSTKHQRHHPHEQVVHHHHRDADQVLDNFPLMRRMQAQIRDMIFSFHLLCLIKSCSNKFCHFPTLKITFQS